MIRVPRGCGMFFIAVLGLTFFQARASAEDPGDVYVVLQPGNAAIAKGTYMITVLEAGKTVFQTETPPRFWPPENKYVSANAHPYKIPPGVYDFRVEGEGVVTVTKRGIQVVSGSRNGRYVYFDLQPGKGVKVIEYSAEGSPKEKK